MADNSSIATAPDDFLQELTNECSNRPFLLLIEGSFSHDAYFSHENCHLLLRQHGYEPKVALLIDRP